MSISWEDDPCPVCEEEPATVRLVTEQGEARLGQKCAALVEAVGRLCGADPKRMSARLVLQVVK